MIFTKTYCISIDSVQKWALGEKLVIAQDYSAAS
jgi:hypothetical protein